MWRRHLQWRQTDVQYVLVYDDSDDPDDSDDDMGEKTAMDSRESCSAIAMNDLYTSSTIQLANKEIASSVPEKLDDYDPFEKRENKSISNAGALAHLLKGSLGTGILAMPNAFRNSGLAFGLIGTLVIGFVCTHCVHMLVTVSQNLCRRTKTPSLDFAATAEAAFMTGPISLRNWSTFARRFLNGCLLATYYSSGVVYVVFIADSLKEVVNHHYQELDIRIYMLMFLVPLALISLIRELKYLVPFSILANLFICVSFAITLYYIFVDLPPISENRKILAAPVEIPIFFSTVIFAMEGIGVVMPIENTMKKPGYFLGCPGVLNIGMSVVISLYAVIGFFGYVKYGEDTKGSITLNLPNDPLAESVKILMAVAILFTYGLQMYVPTKIVWSTIEPKLKGGWSSSLQTCYRLGVVICTFAIAAALPKLGPIISLVGAVCFSTLGLLCPAVIETVALWNDGLGRASWRLYKNVLICVFAVFALVSGSYTSIVEIINTY